MKGGERRLNERRKLPRRRAKRRKISSTYVLSFPSAYRWRRSTRAI